MRSTHSETILSLGWRDLPPPVRRQAKRCLKDILAVAAGSRLLPAWAKWKNLVEKHYGEGPAPLLFAGRTSTLCGACLFNAAAIDSLDWHDGFRPVKGHAGATVAPLVLGSCALKPVSGTELLTALVIGYEIACRAAVALHRTYHPAYHASGSWAALGAAAAGARILGVPVERFDQVLGAAEYYAPMSPMMRVIDSPASVKDSAAAGAWAAATALGMEECGLSGPPSLLAAGNAGGPNDGLPPSGPGGEWLILKQYFNHTRPAAGRSPRWKGSCSFAADTASPSRR